MRSTVIAVVLCLSAAAAAARCVTQAPAAGTGHAGPELINAATPNARALPWDDEPPADPPMTAAARAGEHPAAGPPMILAALALMSGIALRRSSGRMR